MCWELDEYESWEAYQKRLKKPQARPEPKEPVAKVPEPEEEAVAK